MMLAVATSGDVGVSATRTYFAARTTTAQPTSEPAFTPVTAPLITERAPTTATPSGCISCTRNTSSTGGTSVPPTASVPASSGASAGVETVTTGAKAMCASDSQSINWLHVALGAVAGYLLARHR